MKNLTKALALMILSCLIFTACDDDDSHTPISAEESKEIINDLDNQIFQDLSEIKKIEGIEAIKQLLELDEIPLGNSDGPKKMIIIKQMYAALSQQKLMQTDLDNPFDFNNIIGTYTWNSDKEEWDIDRTTPKDRAIINYPINYDGIIKDGRLEILDLQSKKISFDNQIIYRPTNIEANLSVNDSEVISLLFKASLDENGIPMSGNVTFTVEPFSMDFTMNTTTDQGSLEYVLSHKDEQIMAIDLNVGFKNNTLEGIEKKISPENISTVIASFTYHEIKLEADVNVASISKILNDFDGETDSKEEVVAKLNKEFDAGIYQVNTGDRMAILEFSLLEYEHGKELGIVMVFDDGTKQNAQKFCATLSKQIGAMINQLGLDELFRF